MGVIFLGYVDNGSQFEGKFFLRIIDGYVDLAGMKELREIVRVAESLISEYEEGFSTSELNYLGHDIW